MANRFARKIKSGDIVSIVELKSEFKELAKLTHPDLRGPGTEGEFITARAEYEAALRDFERHRFGSRAASGRQPGSGTARGTATDGRLTDTAWTCMALLLKRGFPKVPRHDKEKLRYEYARWRLLEALGTHGGELFGDFESELLDLKAFGADPSPPILRFLRDLMDYHAEGLPAMRTHIVLSLGRLRSDPGVSLAIRGFTELLSLELGIGGELDSEPWGTRG